MNNNSKLNNFDDKENEIQFQEAWMCTLYVVA